MTEIRKVDWSARTSGYLDEMNNPYHAHRTKVLKAMIPDWAMSAGVKIFDFGCGDGFLLPYFLKVGAAITGCDIAPGMIEAARKNVSELGFELDEAALQVGGVEKFKEIPDGSLDGIVALNVLAYLNLEEEEAYYTEAYRTLRSGGFMLVSHSNRLFDMFSLNKYTVAFFSDFLIDDRRYASQMESLLVESTHPMGSKATPLPVRENPMNYGLKLSRYGLTEVRQEFINRHEAPPPILKEQAFPDTLDVPADERWRLFFTCSTFASLSLRD